MRVRFGVEQIGLKMQVSVGEGEEVRLQGKRSAAIGERAGGSGSDLVERLDSSSFHFWIGSLMKNVIMNIHKILLITFFIK